MKRLWTFLYIILLSKERIKHMRVKRCNVFSIYWTCVSFLPVCAFFASCLQNLIQLLHNHRYIDLCAFGKHLGLFLEKFYTSFDNKYSQIVYSHYVPVEITLTSGAPPFTFSQPPSTSSPASSSISSSSRSLFLGFLFFPSFFSVFSLSWVLKTNTEFV